MLRRKNMTALIVCGILSATAPAYADAVTDWNAITLDAVTAGRPGPIGMLDVALVLPPGKTEHAFDPTPKDVARFAGARLAICVGVGMDGWLA